MPALYVHVPFCRKKCDYCTFFSVPDPDIGLIETYLKGLELESAKTQAPRESFSLFVGGGTPTLLNADQLDRLLGIIHRNFVFLPRRESRQGGQVIEKTVEANPGTLQEQKLEVLRYYEINRISLGAQSFNDRMLKTLGRSHSEADIVNAVKLLRSRGFKNINLDLIFGLPGQDLKDWQVCLQKAVELETEHLSLYALTLETGSVLEKRLNACPDRILPDDDQQADMYEWAADFLQRKGYGHYEISNFARPGFECRHNLAYWQGEDYLGLGPAAVSCLNGRRTKNYGNITRYLEEIQKNAEEKPSGAQACDPDYTEILSERQRISEFMMLGLRTAAGVDYRKFTRKFGREIQDIYGAILADYIKRGLLFSDNERLRLNPSYFFVANAIIRDFILET